MSLFKACLIYQPSSSAGLINFFTSCVPLGTCAKYIPRQPPPSAMTCRCGKRREKDIAARFHQLRTGSDHDCGSGTCSSISMQVTTSYCRHVLPRALPRFPARNPPECRFQRVQLCHLQWLKAHIQTGHVAPSRAILSARMPPPQPTSTPFCQINRQHARQYSPDAAGNAVQRFELTFKIPPAGGDSLNLAISSWSTLWFTGDFSAFMALLLRNWQDKRVYQALEVNKRIGLPQTARLCYNLRPLNPDTVEG